MRILVVGATGAIGRRLVPMLCERGHTVYGTSRSSGKRGELEALGAEPVLLDLLDEEAVLRSVAEVKPEVVVHEATAISGSGSNLRKLDKSFELTSRLRTEGTDHVLAAARASGAKQVVAQSFGGYRFERPDDVPKSGSRTMAAIRYLEETVSRVTGIEGVVLRYGFFYGPATSISSGGTYVELVRKRRFPIIGNGAGEWSFIHVDDAARATVLAVDRGSPGIYDVVDDEPALVSEWLPYFARVLGAKPPHRVPAWLGRIVGGELAVALMTEVRGGSNAKAKKELGWEPRYASWREGFAEALH